MRLTKQYAHALLSSTSIENALTMLEELERVSNVLNEFPQYIRMVDFRPEEFDNIRSLLGDDINPLVLNFLEVLAEDGMLSRLDTIIEDYRMILIEENLLFDVKVFSATPLTEKRQEQVINLIESHWGSDYMIEYRVNPEMLGGMRLEVNGAVIDTTFRSRIDQIIREVQHGAKR